ncbi:hypothetical protein PanWU01x14_370510 [Parasponia andersonii]|uniref:Transmembrane protein n=1 Tax=Parasponia andersonii TaxID=3476 RepID=A0A2P5A489_PARAD|nr:hypothetical protein PanWU01x14_370510 [Parasponia andersonii]
MSKLIFLLSSRRPRKPFLRTVSLLSCPLTFCLFLLLSHGESFTVSVILAITLLSPSYHFSFYIGLAFYFFSGFISLGSTHKKIRHYLGPSCPNVSLCFH